MTVSGYSGLSVKWAEYCAARAVLPDIAAEAGLKPVLSGRPDGSGRFAADYGFPQRASGLLIPLYGLRPDSEQPDAPAGYQLRLDDESVLDPPRKFSTPSRQRNLLAVLPRMRERLRSGQQVIVLTEGMTRVYALAAVGMAGVALAGIWSWRGRNPAGGVTALPDFEDLAIRGNRFLLAPDGDVRTNPKVYSAVTRLAAFLHGREADNVMVILPPDQLGLDDWIAQLLAEGKEQMDVWRAIGQACTAVADLPKPPADLGPADDRLSAADYEAMIRCLDAEKERLLAIRQHNGIWALAILEDGGTWRRYQPGALDEALHRSERRYFETLLGSDNKSRDALMKKTQSRIESSPHTRRTIELGCHASVQMALERGIALRCCDERDLDADQTVLGAPNGVIDLDSGELLTGPAAADRLVTRRVADPYDRDAQHEVADRLFAHLPEAERAWLLGALGFALRGSPQRRIYLLLGDPGGGKSTLMRGVTEALGEYGGSINREDIQQTRNTNRHAPRPSLLPFLHARVMAANEVGNIRLDDNLLKMLSGEDSFDARALNQNPVYGTAKATLFLVANDLPRLNLRDRSMRERLHILPYPTVPPEQRDPETLSAVVQQAPVRQALMAALVRAAQQHRRPPETNSMIEEANRRAAAQMDSGLVAWLDTMVQADPNGRVATRRLWDAALVAADNAGGKEAFDLNQSSFSRAVCQHYGLGVPVVLLVDGRQQRAYTGLRLLDGDRQEPPDPPAKPWVDDSDPQAALAEVMEGTPAPAPDCPVCGQPNPQPGHLNLRGLGPCPGGI